MTSNKHHWSYLAGLIDTDGTFVISRQWRTSSNCWNYSVLIKVASTSEEVVKWLVRYFGGVYYAYTPKQQNYRASYTWLVKGAANKERLILSVLPYLGVTRQQANLALQYIRLKGNEYPLDREKMFFEMSRLNHSDSVKIKTTGICRDAYLEGLMDGDGTLSVYKDNRCDYFQPVIRVHNKDRNMLKWITKFYGGSVKLPDENGVSSWQLTGEISVKDVVESVKPFLVIKKSRAESMLRFLKSSSLSDKEIERDILMNLNLRGASKSPQAHTSSSQKD